MCVLAFFEDHENGSISFLEARTKCSKQLQNYILRKDSRAIFCASFFKKKSLSSVVLLGNHMSFWVHFIE